MHDGQVTHERRDDEARDGRQRASTDCSHPRAIVTGRDESPRGIDAMLLTAPPHSGLTSRDGDACDGPLAFPDLVFAFGVILVGPLRWALPKGGSPMLSGLNPTPERGARMLGCSAWCTCSPPSDATPLGKFSPPPPPPASHRTGDACLIPPWILRIAARSDPTVPHCGGSLGRSHPAAPGTCRVVSCRRVLHVCAVAERRC